MTEGRSHDVAEPVVKGAPKIGIFMDLRNPGPDPLDWATHYARSLELVERAEELGSDAVWFSEHHLFEDGYLSQPLVFAAAAAARTSRMRIGTAILIAALRHPRHIAEQAALVDLVSGGRFELGMGPGYAPVEFAAFGLEAGERFRLTDAAVAEVQRLYATDAIRPPSIQAPIPLWLGYQGPKGARRAGRMGVGLLSLDRAAAAAYQEGLAEGGHRPGTARLGGVLDIVVARDPEAAFERLLPHLAHQTATYREAHGSPAQPSDVIADLRRRGRRPESGPCVLTVNEAVAAVAARTEGLPVQHVYFWASVGGMPEEMVEEHLALLLGSVRPEVAAAVVAAGDEEI